MNKKKKIKELKMLIEQYDHVIYFSGFNKEKINRVNENFVKLVKQIINE